MSRHLLAIGGPKHGQWLLDIGHKVIVPLIANPKFTLQDDGLPLSLDYYDTVQYQRRSIRDPETNASTYVYVASYIGDDMAMTMLKEYLLQQFISMGDVTSEVTISASN